MALTHNREQDATNIHKLLAEGNLAICLEGTTCCGEFVLCFSSLFAEFTDQFIPVAMNNRNSIFHGVTGTACKCMDPFFFFMNLRPIHEISFLTPLPRGLTCAAGKSPNDFANPGFLQPPWDSNAQISHTRISTGWLLAMMELVLWEPLLQSLPQYHQMYNNSNQMYNNSNNFATSSC